MTSTQEPIEQKLSAKRIRRREFNLFKKAYAFRQDFNINIAVILYKNGQLLYLLVKQSTNLGASYGTDYM